jgi:DNA repair photolyase
MIGASRRVKLPPNDLHRCRAMNGPRTGSCTGRSGPCTGPGIAHQRPPKRRLVRVLSVNPYRACDIRCAYCVTGAQGESRPRFSAETVRKQLRHELDAMGHLQPRAGLGTLCDAYPSVEAELGVTRIVLDELTRLGWRVTVVTRGAGVRRDIDLVRRGGANVVISLATLDRDALARLEPGAPTLAERVALIRELAEAGVPPSG